MESRFTAECASANAGLITLDSKPSERIDFNLDEYIAGLKWSDQATDHEKTLVIGNLRAMFAVIRERHNALARMALELSNAVVSSTQTEELSSSPTATPRTDAVVRDMVKNRPWWADDRLMKHARQLERELAAAHRRAECFKEAMHSYEKAARVEMASVQSPQALPTEQSTTVEGLRNAVRICRNNGFEKTAKTIELHLEQLPQVDR